MTPFLKAGLHVPVHCECETALTINMRRWKSYQKSSKILIDHSHARMTKCDVMTEELMEEPSKGFVILQYLLSHTREVELRPS